MDLVQYTLFDEPTIKKSHRSQTKGRNYADFVEKFKPKKTTDDCYTPEIVYNAVADWTAQEYGLDRANFVRPFYPGGDYKRFDYDGGKIVVDNPPFSILADIIKYYVGLEIPFLLFSPTLTGLVRYADYCTVFPTGADIEYENGAVVPTSFVTNLDPPEIRARTVPSLYQAVTDANEENRRAKRVILPKYHYPPELITAAAMYPFARVGIEFVVTRSESVRVSELDAQKPIKKQIFGCGWLLSHRLTAEREKAEREKAERFALSAKELELIASLS